MRPHLPLLLAAATLAIAGCSAAQGAPTTAASSPAGAVAAESPASATSPADPPATGTPTTAAPSPSAVSPTPTPTPTSVVAPEAVGSPAPVDSLVLGDSISLGIASDLSTYGYPVIGRVGQSASSAYLREHLSSDLAQRARTWVIVLGTNNSGSPEDVAALPDLVALIDSLRTPGAKQQVRWVTPHRPDAYIGTKTAYNLDAFNAELSLLAMSHPWLRILDFDILAKANPEWFDDDRAMHLHPNADGRAALVALITGQAPAPASSRAPVIDAGALTGQTSGSGEPETFDNRTLPPTPPTSSAAPSPDASPSPAPATSGGASLAPVASTAPTASAPAG